MALVLDPAPELWAGLPLTAPQTKFVWQLTPQDLPDFGQPLDAVAEAHRWMRAALPSVLRIPGGYWQGLHDVTIGSSLAMGRYAAFEAERVRLLALHSARAGVGAFATGAPVDLRWWEPFVPALQAARDHGGVLLLRQRGWPRLGSQDCPELRHRKVYAGDAASGWAGLPVQYRVPLIISECGLDGQATRPGWVQGWRGIVSAEEYLRQLDEYSQALEADDYVLGACVYCMHAAPQDAQARTYDIWPEVAQTMMRQAVPLYRATGERARGVDVSEYRGVPDWKRAVASGIAFAFVRASVGLREDRQWQRNAREARSQGLVVMPYHRQTPHDPADEQALAHLQAIGSGWPITWVDAEVTDGVPLTDEGVRAFVQRVQQAGQAIGLYSSEQMVAKCGIAPWAAKLPRWWADWVPRYLGRPRLPSGWPPGWNFQQITSSGTVPGIEPPVDLDIFNGTAVELATWLETQAKA